MKTSIAALALAAASLLPSLAHAAFPDKPVKIIIGFPAGGPLDGHGRLLADKLQAALGQPVIIDYKAGAGGSVGAEYVAKSAADGYTLMLANTGVMVINPAVYPKLSYQTLRDFVPIARTAQQPLALVVHPGVAAKNVAELVALAKQSPGKLNYGSAGNGGSSHLVPEMFKQATGSFIVHIPYKGSAPAMTDLLAGQVQMMAESVPLASQYVKQGKLRALAVTGQERSPALPDIPTFAELGVKGMEVVGFYGILAPAATPKDVVAKLSEAFRQVLSNPEVQKTMTTQGADPAFLNSEQFARYLADEMPRWARTVERSGTKLD
ncbi:Bug family tripartite tricarboxylate transporter substrate binding protein [Aquabacterium sp.]|uniref:Bug family tripartite tricarboxylate transporter substrate binding protein n=1 Tax=Aquabacterium sp. TaxID=1872578 RepID=UPI002C15C267|nr:tripartite tricarboxylate transporter substrate binding protein [Aquabacterium sp.]HSW04059.1 tripartite tricarboxylate transporter substrate binding protein [Aquabacterium sp.]